MSDARHTLLLRLAGPMQAWGVQSRFAVREAGTEPSKSGVLGLVAAAMGRSRTDGIDDLAALRFGVRVDREGVPSRDYHTAGQAMLNRRGKSVGYYRAKGRIESSDVIPTERFYLADACFTVGLEAEGSEGLALLDRAYRFLCDPCWPLFLGRRAFPPSLPVALPVGEALQPKPLLPALVAAPFSSRGRTSEREVRLIVPPDVAGPEAQTRLAGPDQPQAFGPRTFATRTVAVLYRQRPTASVQEGRDQS